jgi:hypothetical protein
MIFAAKVYSTIVKDFGLSLTASSETCQTGLFATAIAAAMVSAICHYGINGWVSYRRGTRNTFLPAE